MEARDPYVAEAIHQMETIGYFAQSQGSSIPWETARSLGHRCRFSGAVSRILTTAVFQR